MTFRRYMLSMLWLVALGVICRGHDPEIDGLAPTPAATRVQAVFLVKPYLQLGDGTATGEWRRSRLALARR